MRVVSSATPLRHLAAIGHLDLLRDLFGRVYIPEDAYRELLSDQDDAWVRECHWIEPRAVRARLALSLLRSKMPEHEASCIALGMETKADLVLVDERVGQLYTEAPGARVCGTLAVLLLADEMGILDFRTALDDLEAAGSPLTPAEHHQVLKLWGARQENAA